MRSAEHPLDSRDQATVTLHESAEAVADRVWPGMGVVEAIDDRNCLLHVGADTPLRAGLDDHLRRYRLHPYQRPASARRRPPRTGDPLPTRPPSTMATHPHGNHESRVSTPTCLTSLKARLECSRFFWTPILAAISLSFLYPQLVFLKWQVFERGMSSMGVAVGLIQSNGFFVRCFTVGHATVRRRWPRWCTAAIEQSAREHGRRRAILEAGTGQPEGLTRDRRLPPYRELRLFPGMAGMPELGPREL